LIKSTVANYARTVVQYCDDVQTGRRIAGKAERDAVARYLADREREANDPTYPFKFDQQLAESCCQFFPLLQHTDGEYAGKPFELYPWQVFIVWNLFGWVRKDNGYRRFREAFLSVARGNGKTPFGAGVMLLAFACDTPIEERAEVYSTAVKRDQAALSFGAAKRFVERSPELSSYIQVLKYDMQIQSNGSKFMPLSSDAKSADGLQIHGLLRDELHAWTEQHRGYYEKLQTALGKRRQPLAVTITTAGSEESLLWQEQYDIAKQVVDQNNRFAIDSLFVFICEIDDEDDELDEQCWPKANPMLEYGVVKIEHLRTMADTARSNPTFRHQLRRYHCNKLAYSHNKAFTAELWGRGNQALPPPEKMRRIFAGVDLGWCDDIAAIGYVAPLDWVSIEGQSKRRYAVWCDAWMPRGTKRDLKREPFANWARTGRLNVTESEWTDTQPMYARLREIHAKHQIKSMAFDPYNAREFATVCQNEIRLQTFAFQQSHSKYHEPLKEFKIAVGEGRILHGGDDVLSWASQNVVEEENSKGHRMPSKLRSVDKIDPFVAVLMAFSEAIFDERKGPSIYEKRGPILIG
jgi:phage terminase large subunit-like protein